MFRASLLQTRKALNTSLMEATTGTSKGEQAIDLIEPHSSQRPTLERHCGSRPMLLPTILFRRWGEKGLRKRKSLLRARTVTTVRFTSLILMDTGPNK